MFVPASYTFERKEHAASWENDPYINFYGNEGIVQELLRCIHDTYEQEVSCCALLLTQLSHSSFVVPLIHIQCILLQHALARFRDYSIATFNQQLEYILACFEAVEADVEALAKKQESQFYTLVLTVCYPKNLTT